MYSSETVAGPPWDWDEQRLVTGIAAKQPEARAALVTASHDAVFAFACRLSPVEDLRRDWTHDCLLRIITDIETGAFELRHPGGFWSWFRKRSWFLMLEARRNHRRRSTREIPIEDLALDPPGGVTPMQDLENSEIAAAIDRCLDEIDHDGHRQVMRLFLLRDLPYADVAAELETPLNTVRAWVRRGRLELRRCLRRRLGLISEADGS